MSAAAVPNLDYLQVSCPLCGALAGQLCVDMSRWVVDPQRAPVLSTVHSERIEATVFAGAVGHPDGTQAWTEDQILKTGLV